MLGSKNMAFINHWGRAELANRMVLARFRYLAQTKHLPKEIMNAMASDVHALI